jgi:CubicO group peptidase (beta-lactamase class C family)
MFIRFTLLLATFFFSYSCVTSQDPNYTKSIKLFSDTLNVEKKAQLAQEIKLKYEKLLGKNFSGEIIVSKNGQIIFEDYKGYINFATKTPMNAESPIHLASISKTFTGMAILKLWEQKKIDLTSSVASFFPGFPYADVTIEQLLSHRSGLPDYTHFMESQKYALKVFKNKRGRKVKRMKLVSKEPPYRIGNYNNGDVLSYMIEKRPARQAMPNMVFKYCNTNYVLLALIIEKITRKDYPTYMSETIFKPLNMNNTFIFNAKVADKYFPSYDYRLRPYKIEKYDFIYGDKNVYSTVRDMVLWDNALSSGSFLAASTLDMAYEPKSPVVNNYHNYGFGWRMLLKPNEDKIIYHNGWWHGNNTVFTRLLSNSTSIIILGNRFNKTIYKGKEIASIFTGKQDTTSLLE